MGPEKKVVILNTTYNHMTSYRNEGCNYHEYFFSKKKSLFFERETVCVSVGEGRTEREKENLKQALHYQHRAQCGAQTHDRKITTQADIKSLTLNQLSHQALRVFLLYFVMNAYVYIDTY